AACPAAAGSACPSSVPPAPLFRPAVITPPPPAPPHHTSARARRPSAAPPPRPPVLPQPPAPLRPPTSAGAAPPSDDTPSRRAPWPPDPFRYLDGRLCVGGLPLEEGGAATGTPAHGYSRACAAAA